MTRIIPISLATACMFQIAILLLAVVPVTAEENDVVPVDKVLLTQGIKQLTTDGSDKDQIVISGNRAAWAQGNGIKVMDLTTLQVTDVGLKVNFSLKMDGDRLLVDNKIYYLNNGTWARMALPQQPIGSLDISGDNILVSLDVSNNTSKIDYDMFQYRIPDRTLFQVASTPQYQSQPAIWGNEAAWVDARSGQKEIYLKDLSKNGETRITNFNSIKTRPDIYNDVVVWTDFRSTAKIVESNDANLDIYMYNGTLGTTTQVTKNTSYQNHAQIYGDRIVYNDYGTGNFDVCMYTISSGAELRLTTSERNQLWPHIWGDKVVWLEAYYVHNGTPKGLDVYMCDLALDSDNDLSPNYLDPDDDNDKYTDAQEIENGTDPLDRKAFPVKKDLSDDDDRNMIYLFVAVAVVVIILILVYVLYQRSKR